MKSSLTKIVLPIIFMLSILQTSGCRTSSPQPEYEVSSQSSGVSIGEYKGYEAVNRVIRDRLLGPESKNKTFRLGNFIGAGKGQGGLTVLLGGFSGEGSTNKFRNGRPNSVNTAIWTLTLRRFIFNLVDCQAPGTSNRGFYAISSDLLTLLNKACSWPDRTLVSDDILDELWLTVMGFHPPKEEREKWRSFFTASNSPYKDEDGESTVRSMLLTMLMHPNFLLNAN